MFLANLWPKCRKTSKTSNALNISNNGFIDVSRNYAFHLFFLFCEIQNSRERSKSTERLLVCSLNSCEKV